MIDNYLIHVRKLLIRVGKILPFVVCFVVFISYLENMYAMLTENYLYYEDYYVLNKPLSNQLGVLFEYNVQTLFILVIISISIRTCLYNKLACFYLGINIYEKSYFMEHVYDNGIYYIVIILNLIIASYLTIKGILKIKHNPNL